MPIILGLDVGDVRVGVALSDLSALIASPFATYDRAQGRAEKAILELCQNRNVSIIVVGLPLNDDNSKNEQCLKVENFCRRLLKRVALEIHYVDEYASSVDAEERLAVSRGRKNGRGRAKGELDAAAAAIILQTFLDQKKHLD